MPELEQLDTDHPWEQLPTENAKWYSRFELYKDMGPARRSVLGAYRLEKASYGESTDRVRFTPSSWRDAQSTYRWKERAAAWDAHLRETRFNLGYAAFEYRVGKMDALLHIVEPRIEKMFETAAPPKGIHIELVELYRLLMGDMAAEVGGRQKNMNVKAEVNAEVNSTFRTVWAMPERGDPDDDILQMTPVEGDNADVPETA